MEHQTWSRSHVQQPAYRYAPTQSMQTYPITQPYPLAPPNHSPPHHHNDAYYQPRKSGQSSRSRGLDYLRDLHTEINKVELQGIRPGQRTSLGDTDKPLPRLPAPPPLPDRPFISVSHSAPRLSQPAIPSASPQEASSSPTEVPRPYSLPPSVDIAPQKYFRPSAYLRIPESLLTGRPDSDPIPTSRKEKGRRKALSSVDKTYIPSSSEDEPILPGTVTNRSHDRRRRAASEQPPRTKTPTSTPKNTRGPTSTLVTEAIRCAGFTRSGQPCKRLVRAAAPYLLSRDPNVQGDGEEEGEEAPRLVGRYCKDHAGMICEVGGFYWTGGKVREGSGVWIGFDEFIPRELGQQTQALLRMTMESRLTEKETPGFIYAYELRDLQTTTTSFFKVGRTDNVPRRIGEWSTRCRSHHPTLRDIFPLSHSFSHKLSPQAQSTALLRKPSAPTSYLPGAIPISPTKRPLPAVKRWERLVHLELADRSSASSPEAYKAVREQCEECDAVHREVFPLSRRARDGGRNGHGDEVEVEVEVYEGLREVVERWGRFIRRICRDEG